MTTKAVQITLAAALVLGLTACPDGAGSEADTEADMGTSGETEGLACDPVGVNPAAGELLNAPVEDDVEVIVKTPQHPGAPGPDDLP